MKKKKNELCDILNTNNNINVVDFYTFKRHLELFCGGNKSSQKKDIEKAKEYKFILDKYGLENCIKR